MQRKDKRTVSDADAEVPAWDPVAVWQQRVLQPRLARNAAVDRDAAQNEAAATDNSAGSSSTEAGGSRQDRKRGAQGRTRTGTANKASGF